MSYSLFKLFAVRIFILVYLFRIAHLQEIVESETKKPKNKLDPEAPVGVVNWETHGGMPKNISVFQMKTFLYNYGLFRRWEKCILSKGTMLGCARNSPGKVVDDIIRKVNKLDHNRRLRHAKLRLRQVRQQKRKIAKEVKLAKMEKKKKKKNLHKLQKLKHQFNIQKLKLTQEEKELKSKIKELEKESVPTTTLDPFKRWKPRIPRISYSRF